MAGIKKSIKTLLQRLLPAAAFQRLAAVRSRRHQVRFLQQNGTLDRVKHHIEEHGTVILDGPFKGMIYPLDSATIRSSLPKLLGSYEDELHPFLERLSGRSYDCIIDVGSAEGYYAVGLARIFQVPVYAYDPEPFEKSFSAAMAERNGVGHLVRMGELFTVEDMARYADRRVLLVCDCEGFEQVLFRPDTLHITRNWDLIIELHGEADPVVSSLPWPHATALVPTRHKTGPFDEQRPFPQRFLLCDSQKAASSAALLEEFPA